MSGIDKAGNRKSGNERVPAKEVMRKGKGKKVRGSSASIGRALRLVYDDTLGEDVPADFLDLLGKLG